MSSHQRISMSRPSPGEAGRTGDWRSSRPVMQAELCLAVKADTATCQLCWAYCPDACFAKGVPPAIELEYCKGCGICAQECPSGAIVMVPEREHGVCEMPEDPSGDLAEGGAR
ncbi:MAG: 4Fe-4S binding protein [Anaerosomatales bacterium]|nr:4Fe-4S binding protein [Anaerosomatales bacterium]MDT8434577.1 4Fe-4S binding protein [Anaerosomatales bacterium]